MNKAEQLIACLEGEIAKRDETIARLEPQLNRAIQANYDLREELAACRVAVENCELFRARVAELEEKLAVDDDANFNLRGLLKRGAFALDLDPENTSWFEAIGELEKQSAELAAIKAQEPVRYWFIGDAGQEKGSRHCRKSSSDGSLAFFESELDAKNAAQRHHGTEVYAVNYYAAPAAPAADAWIVDMYRHLQKVTPYRFKKIQDTSITDGGDVMYFHKDRFDAALLADMAAHSSKGVV